MRTVKWCLSFGVVLAGVVVGYCRPCHECDVAPLSPTMSSFSDGCCEEGCDCCADDGAGAKTEAKTNIAATAGRHIRFGFAARAAITAGRTDRTAIRESPSDNSCTGCPVRTAGAEPSYCRHGTPARSHGTTGRARPRAGARACGLGARQAPDSTARPGQGNMIAGDGGSPWRRRACGSAYAVFAVRWRR